MRSTMGLLAMMFAAAAPHAVADDWATQEWREATGAYGGRWAVVPDGSGYLFVVAENPLESPDSDATLRLVVDDPSADITWISDGPIALQVDGYPALIFADCAMNPLTGRFGSDSVDLFCTSNRDRAVMEIRDGGQEQRFLERLRSGRSLKVSFIGTDGSANTRSFSLRKSGQMIRAVLEQASMAQDGDPVP